MAVVEFELDDETAQVVAAFFKRGRRGALTFHVENRRVIDVEMTQRMPNGMGIRRFLPGATGVNLAEKA